MPLRLKLAFGKQGAGIALPDGFDYVVLDAKSADALADPTTAIEAALDRPMAGPPLVELAQGKRTAAISVCDITRPAPNRIVLPPVLRRLEASGIDRANIVILIATGLHRGATVEEIRETLLHTMVYAGIPCGVEAFNAAAEVLARHGAGGKP